MAFLLSFSQAIIVLFTYPLVLSWVVIIIGEPKGNNYQDKAHNILSFVFAGGITLGIFPTSQQVTNPLFILLPVSLLLITIATLRLKYQEDYAFD